LKGRTGGGQIKDWRMLVMIPQRVLEKFEPGAAVSRGGLLVTNIDSTVLTLTRFEGYWEGTLDFETIGISRYVHDDIRFLMTLVLGDGARRVAASNGPWPKSLLPELQAAARMAESRLSKEEMDLVQDLY